MSSRLPQLYRLLILCGIIAVVHLQAKRLERSAKSSPITAAEVSPLFPDRPTSDLQVEGDTVNTSDGSLLGTLIQTSPTGDHITGYVGPTNTLLAFDPEGKCIGAVIRRSADTKDHVRKIEKEPSFFRLYRGRTADEIAEYHELDAVSGATLTAMAIRESVALTFGGEAASLKFPDPLTEREASQLIPGAIILAPHPDGLPAMLALDAEGTLLGLLLRTGPAADDIPGYQGPTETIIALDPTGTSITALKMRGSYETLDYAQQVRGDTSYFEKLAGHSVADWIKVPTPSELGVEGISGATYTSYAMAEGVQQTLSDFASARDRLTNPLLSLTDWILLGFLAIALLLAFTRLRKVRPVVRIFQIACVLYLGFLGGHMLAQTLLVGWAIHGVPWASAIGLSALVAAAFLIPALTGRNVYCQHLCPHGAAQQFLMGVRWKGKQPWRINVPAKLAKVLGLIPPTLLILVIASVVLGKGLNLAALEPFDAYLFPAAGIATVVIALLGLVASFFHPMAYCKFGCPTGHLIELTRFHRSKEGFGKRELVATAVLALAATSLLF